MQNVENKKINSPAAITMKLKIRERNVQEQIIRKALS